MRSLVEPRAIGGKGGKGGGGGPGGPGGGPGAGPGGPGAPGGKPAMTPEQADDKSRERLINSTPQARAGMEQMRLDKATARAQLGLGVPGSSRRVRV